MKLKTTTHRLALFLLAAPWRMDKIKWPLKQLGYGTDNRASGAFCKRLLLN